MMSSMSSEGLTESVNSFNYFGSNTYLLMNIIKQGGYSISNAIGDLSYFSHSGISINCIQEFTFPFKQHRDTIKYSADKFVAEHYNRVRYASNDSNDEQLLHFQQWQGNNRPTNSNLNHVHTSINKRNINNNNNRHGSDNKKSMITKNHTIPIPNFQSKLSAPVMVLLYERLPHEKVMLNVDSPFQLCLQIFTKLNWKCHVIYEFNSPETELYAKFASCFVIDNCCYAPDADVDFQKRKELQCEALRLRLINYNMMIVGMFSEELTLDDESTKAYDFVLTQPILENLRQVIANCNSKLLQLLLSIQMNRPSL